MVLRSRSDNENCDRGTIDKGYRLAKVFAEDERLGLVALDDGRGSSPGSAVATDSTLSVVGDGNPPYENLHHSVGAALTRTNFPDRPIDDGSELGDPMNIYQLHFGDSDGSESGDEDYMSSGESTVVKYIESSNAIAESPHHLEEQESQYAENPSVNFEDDAHYTNSSGGEDSDEEVGIRTNMHGPLIANLDDDDYSADVEFDPTNESIYGSAEDIAYGSEDMSLSSGDDSDATNQRGVNHMNIRDLFFADLEADDTSDTDFDPAAESAAESEEKMEDSFEGSNGPSDKESDATIEPNLNNMSIRDLFYADIEVDHPSDGDFDAASETSNDSEENIDNDSNDADSDYTEDPNDTAMTLLDLVRQGDIDDRSSDEEYQPADKGTNDVRVNSESDKENSEEQVRVQSFLSDFRSLTYIHKFRLRYLARRRYHQSLIGLQSIALILHFSQLPRTIPPWPSKSTATPLRRSGGRSPPAVSNSSQRPELYAATRLRD